MVCGTQEAGRIGIGIRRLEGGKLCLISDFLPDLVDVVVGGDRQVEHFFVTVLVESDSVIVEVPTQGVTKGEVDVYRTPVDVVDETTCEDWIEGLVVDATAFGL